MFWCVDKRKSVKEYDSSGHTTEIIDLVWDIASLDTEFLTCGILSLLFSILGQYKLNLMLPFPKEVENGHPSSSFGAFLWPGRDQLLRVVYQAWKGSLNFKCRMCRGCFSTFRVNTVPLQRRKWNPYLWLLFVNT